LRFFLVGQGLQIKITIFISKSITKKGIIWKKEHNFNIIWPEKG